MRRTHEIGIRMALGAKSGDILVVVVGQGLLLALLGLAIGLTGVLGLTRILAKMLVGITSTDPTTFAGVAALLTGIVLIACYVPARRAMGVDPLLAPRYE